MGGEGGRLKGIFARGASLQFYWKRKWNPEIIGGTKKITSIRDLATEAGCSHTTVSLALRNHPRVSLETRERIQKLADKLGYRRDPLVSSLMGQLRVNRQRRSVETLGILNFWDTPEGDRLTSLGQELHQGIQERAGALGYTTDYIWAREPGMTARRLSRILSARGIRGVIILSMLHARGHVALDWKRFAAASVGFTLHKPELHRANYSHYHSMFLALRTLRHRGYRRIGYVSLIGQEDMVNNERLSAYLGYHFRVDGELAIPPLLVKEWDWRTLGPWLEEYRPQVILSNNVAPMLLARQHGIRVPEDLGFATMDLAGQAMPYAGVRQPRDLVGARAVDLVVEQLEKHETGLPKVPKLVTVKGYWQDGSTLLPKALR